MAYVGLLLVVVANCVVLFFAAFLAAGGDASANGVKAVWLWGYPWVATCSVAALVLLFRGSRFWLAVAVGTLPAGWAASLLFMIGAALLGYRVG
jgi:hypothetical protein